MIVSFLCFYVIESVFYKGWLISIVSQFLLFEEYSKLTIADSDADADGHHKLGDSFVEEMICL